MNYINLAPSELKDFMDDMVVRYNRPEFIDFDPISIPHRFTKKEDREIAGFLAATIAWGNRKMILNSADKIMNLMDNSPYDFVMNHQDTDFLYWGGSIHRTFNAMDLQYFIKALQNIYLHHGGLEAHFNKYKDESSLQGAIHDLKSVFFELDHPDRTTKHIADPERGSSAKRINMFLRWMVRNDNAGVDFGCWKELFPAILSCPLDVHSGNIAREVGLLHRKQNDARAVAELDIALRNMDATDPVKYDFALFGLGVFKKEEIG